ncbi:hypothetical protein P3T23_002811 [Paraburkholderia sp. GAS448]|uniref:hypothetical protein n=1 Tax=Paraburkholderia sp. GAS448 TaxID=3035136 RepID=UPI003D1FDC60
MSLIERPVNVCQLDHLHRPVLAVIVIVNDPNACCMRTGVILGSAFALCSAVPGEGIVIDPPGQMAVRIC